MQIGGSDQWGNIINGVELIRRSINQSVFGLTTPLLTTANGQKMGKTEDGAIWLNEDLLSSYDYWQFWRNVDDRDVIKFIKLFTDLDIKKISDLDQNKNLDVNELKIILADQATTLLHGENNADTAKEAAKEVFSNKSSSTDLPTIKISEVDLNNKIFINDLIVQVKFAHSKSESRKLIRGKGVKKNQIILTNEMEEITKNDFVKNNEILISIGKKKHFRVVLK